MSTTAVYPHCAKCGREIVGTATMLSPPNKLYHPECAPASGLQWYSQAKPAADTSREAVEALIAKLIRESYDVATVGGYRSAGTAMHSAASMLSSLLSERDAAKTLVADMSVNVSETDDDRKFWMAKAEAAEAEIASLRTKLEECARERDALRANFDSMGNYIPHSQIDGDLRAAEAARAKAEEDAASWRRVAERCESERRAARTGANNG